MIIENEKNTITRSNEFPSKKFECDSSIMAILRSGIYSNKPLSCLRELSCNSFDAHVEAGIREIPIEVTLPTIFDPVLRIRDYGNSMDEETVRELYSVYGKSSKRNSNSQVGSFGIGKVAGLAYSSSFQLTCIKDGIKRIYSIYVNETGEDQIDLLFSGNSDERTGTEVCVNVEQKDISLFKNIAEEFFRFWDVHPVINEGSGYVKQELKWFLLRDNSWGFLNESDHYKKGSFVVDNASGAHKTPCLVPCS